MKVLRAPGTWSAEIVCLSCDALLYVDENDLSFTPEVANITIGYYSPARASFECAYCSKTQIVKSLSSAVMNRLRERHFAYKNNPPYR